MYNIESRNFIQAYDRVKKRTEFINENLSQDNIYNIYLEELCLFLHNERQQKINCIKF